MCFWEHGVFSFLTLSVACSCARLTVSQRHMPSKQPLAEMSHVARPRAGQHKPTCAGVCHLERWSHNPFVFYRAHPTFSRSCLPLGSSFLGTLLASSWKFKFTFSLRDGFFLACVWELLQLYSVLLSVFAMGLANVGACAGNFTSHVGFLMWPPRQTLWPVPLLVAACESLFLLHISYSPPPGTLDILVFIFFRMLVYSQILQFVELVCHCDDGLVTNLVIAGFPDPTPFKRKRCGSSHFMNVMMCWL